MQQNVEYLCYILSPYKHYTFSHISLYFLLNLGNFYMIFMSINVLSMFSI